MRFGLIGYGAWGRQHAQTIAGLSGLSLTTIACASEASAAAAKSAYPSAVVTCDWRDAVADSRFDLALWYFASAGDPVTLRAHGNRRAGRDAGLFDNVSILFRFAGGAYVTINQCVAGFEHSLVLEIAGTDGAVRTHWSGAQDRD